MREILIGAAGAIIATLIVAAAEGIFGALSSLLGPPVPPGAVVAFDGECPKEGWEPYQIGAGRFLLGADKTRDLHDEGGSEKHTLTLEEMPIHNHDGGGFLVARNGENTVKSETDKIGKDEINIRHGLEMFAMGGGQPHNNMPPYLVVNFCEKR